MILHINQIWKSWVHFQTYLHSEAWFWTGPSNEYSTHLLHGPFAESIYQMGMQFWMHLLNNVALKWKSIGSSLNSSSHALESRQNMFVWYIERCTLNNHVWSFRARHLMEFIDRLGEKLYMYYIRIICLVLPSYKCVLNKYWTRESKQLRYWMAIVNCAYLIKFQFSSPTND